MRKFLLVVILFLFVNPPNAMALSCVAAPAIEEAYEKYDGIITASVEDVIRKKENNQIKLKVIRSFKGIEEASVLVSENMTWGALDGPSEIGEQYLFFLRQKEGVWENPLCSPSLKVADASDKIDYLQAKEIILKATASPTITPTPTASPIDTLAAPPLNEEKGSFTFELNWLVILILGCLVLIIGYGIVRYSKRKV